MDQPIQVAITRTDKMIRPAFGLSCPLDHTSPNGMNIAFTSRTGRQRPAARFWFRWQRPARYSRFLPPSWTLGGVILYSGVSGATCLVLVGGLYTPFPLPGERGGGLYAVSLTAAAIMIPRQPEMLDPRTVAGAQAWF